MCLVICNFFLEISRIWLRNSSPWSHRGFFLVFFQIFLFSGNVTFRVRIIGTRTAVRTSRTFLLFFLQTKPNNSYFKMHFYVKLKMTKIINVANLFFTFFPSVWWFSFRILSDRSSCHSTLQIQKRVNKKISNQRFK